MMEILRSADRGATRLGWLDSKHSFSFGDYYDPKRMGFSVLRVINEDVVEPAQGFGTHPHRDMEIFTWIISGAIEHKDSLGTGSVIRPGDAQKMTAGTGVLHSEFNPSPVERAHFLQIWIQPARRGLPPGYEQKAFPEAERRGRLRAVASPDGRDGSVRLQQEASILSGLLDKGESATHKLAAGRSAWLQVIAGQVGLGGKTLLAGDGAAL